MAAFFGSPQSFLGLDIGTSSIKLVELVDRKKRIELTTYASAAWPNALLEPSGPAADDIQATANLIARMLDASQAVSDTAVVALPSSITFSSVLTLPDLRDKDLDKAVRFAARDIIPTNLKDMVLGWSRVGENPHMDVSDPSAASAPAPTRPTPSASTASQTLPVFITAAPQDIVQRYTQVIKLLKLNLEALEVETFPLARSLLASAQDSALIVDLGDKTTTFHLIDQGTPRVSHSLDYGGSDITAAITSSASLTREAAEAEKTSRGLTSSADSPALRAISTSLERLLAEAKRVVDNYHQDEGRLIKKTILIGGGANLPGLTDYWSRATKTPVVIGNPWQGLSFPQELNQQLPVVGSHYAVAVGLALRGFQTK
jgi:type IV pilus assembly protein PilM